MAKTFYPAGVLDIMARLDLGILKLILRNSGLPSYADARIAYDAYLKDYANDEWYECCSRLYDIDLVSFYNQSEAMLIIDNLKSEGCIERFHQAAELPGSITVSDMLAWISINMPQYWDDLIHEAYANQVEAGGCKYYLGKPIPDMDGEINSKKRQLDFKRDFCQYLTEHRSKVENVHIDMNPFREMTRFVIYHDPFPRKGSEFENGEITQRNSKEAEHITIIYFKEEDYPYVTIKGKDISPDHEPEIARIFINWILGFYLGAKPRFRYNMNRFNDDYFELPDLDDANYAGSRMSSVKIMTRNPDRSVDTVTFESSKYDVKRMSDAYLRFQNIPRSRCKYAEVRFDIGLYRGAKQPQQRKLDGSFEDVRPLNFYEVKITNGERSVLRCRNRTDKAVIESFLDKWGIVNENEQVL